MPTNQAFSATTCEWGYQILHRPHSGVPAFSPFWNQLSLNGLARPTLHLIHFLSKSHIVWYLNFIYMQSSMFSFTLLIACTTSDVTVRYMSSSIYRHKALRAIPVSRSAIFQYEVNNWCTNYHKIYFHNFTHFRDQCYVHNCSTIITTQSTQILQTGNLHGFCLPHMPIWHLLPCNWQVLKFGTYH